MVRRNNNRRRRVAVRTAPKAPASQPRRTFTRTLRQTQILAFTNTSTFYATLNAVVKADPRNFQDWALAASPFEMFRVKRLRAFVLPSTLPAASFQALLQNISATTIWTAPDYTNDEQTLGNNIKSYQNARFHSMSLNGFKKIVDTDVRLNSTQGGVIPPSTWLPTQAATTAGGWDPTQINYSGFQLWAENPALYNVSPSLQASLSLVYELDVEFKQPGFVTPATSLTLPGRQIIDNDNENDENETDPLPSPTAPKIYPNLKKESIPPTPPMDKAMQDRKKMETFMRMLTKG